MVVVREAFVQKHCRDDRICNTMLGYFVFRRGKRAKAYTKSEEKYRTTRQTYRPHWMARSSTSHYKYAWLQCPLPLHDRGNHVSIPELLLRRYIFCDKLGIQGQSDSMKFLCFHGHSTWKRTNTLFQT